MARLPRNDIHVDVVVDHDVVGDVRRADILGPPDDIADLRVVVDDVDPQVRRQEAPRRHRHPVIVGNVVGVDVDRYLDAGAAVRRQWRPDHVVVAAPPTHPGRRPALSGHPVPAHILRITPAAIMIGGPAEGLVRHPGPAIGPGIDPVTLGIGPPVAMHIRRDEHVLIVVVDPVAIGTELVVEDADADVDGGLGLRGEAGRAELRRCREGEGRNGRAGQNCLEFHGCVLP